MNIPTAQLCACCMDGFAKGMIPIVFLILIAVTVLVTHFDISPHSWSPQVVHQMREREIRAALVSEKKLPELAVVGQVKMEKSDSIVRIQALSSPTRFFTLSKSAEVVIFDAAMTYVSSPMQSGTTLVCVCDGTIRTLPLVKSHSMFRNLSRPVFSLCHLHLATHSVPSVTASLREWYQCELFSILGGMGNEPGTTATIN